MIRKRTLTPLILLALQVGILGENLVLNPGFEEKDGNRLTHWKIDLREEPGKGAAKGVATALAFGKSCGMIRKENGHVVALKQRVNVAPGQKYLFSAWTKGQGRLICYEYDEKGNMIRVSGKAGKYSPVWRPIFTEFITQPGTKTCEIRFEIYGVGFPGTGYIDNVYFGKAPETLVPSIRDFEVRNPSGRKVKLEWAKQDGENIQYLLFRSEWPDRAQPRAVPYKILNDTKLEEELPVNWENGYYAVAALDEFNRIGELTLSVPVFKGAEEQQGKAVIWMDSVMNKIRRYQSFPTQQEKLKIALSLAGNETESAQILVSASHGKLTGIEVASSGLRPENGAQLENRLKITLLQTHYTAIPTPTMGVAEPGLFADPLPPLQGAFDIPAYATQSIWYQVTAAPDCPPGEYKGNVTLRDGSGEIIQIPVSVKVRNFSLPLAPSAKSSFGIFGRHGLAEFHKVKMGSPEYRKIYEQYYWFLVERRLMPRELPVPPDSEDAVRFMADPRVVSTNLTSHGESRTVERIAEIADSFRARGWLDKGFAYVIDEPPVKDYPKCVEFARNLRERAGKNIPFLLTLNRPVRPELIGSVDIWCMLLDRCDWKFLAERQASGEKVWWYTCNIPQGAFPTYLADDIGISHRVLSWLQVYYQIDGVLYWAVDYWRNPVTRKVINPWETADIYSDCNGAGSLVYPGIIIGLNHPVTSQRLEILRDGNEDVEYFNILRRRLRDNGVSDVEKRIQQLIHPVARSLTDWNKSPEKLMRQREIIAAEIERLGSR